jgi:Tol biopolymer transport system component
VDLAGGSPVRLSSTGDARLPSFSADGQRIVFSRSVEGTNFIYEMPAQGGEARRLFAETAQGNVPSPDGRFILVIVDNQYELWPASGEGERLKLGFGGGARRWRPDSKAFAFARGNNIWLYEIGAAKPKKLSNFGANERVMLGLAWTPDGKEIIFARRSEASDIVLLEGIR